MIKKITLIIGGLFLAILAFLIADPSFSDLGTKPITDYWQKIGDPGSTINSIIRRIEHEGFVKATIDHCKAAYLEEMGYRGPILLLLLLLGAPRYWKQASAWLLALVMSYLWTIQLHTNYVVLVQALIFAGGLINGACVIHFKNKVVGLLAAIVLHGLMNTIFFGVVYYFLM